MFDNVYSNIRTFSEENYKKSKNLIFITCGRKLYNYNNTKVP